MNKIVKISFTETGSRRRTWETGINIDCMKKAIDFDPELDNLNEKIIEAAIKKLFGKPCFWHGDSGLGQFEYGQVFKPIKNDHGNTSVTQVVFVDIK